MGSRPLTLQVAAGAGPPALRRSRAVSQIRHWVRKVQ